MDNSIVKKKFSITKFWVLHVTKVYNVRAEKMTSETRFPLGNKQSIISGIKQIMSLFLEQLSPMLSQNWPKVVTVHGIVNRSQP